MRNQSLPHFSRRDFLRLLALGGGSLLVSCSKAITPMVTGMPPTPGRVSSTTTPTPSPTSTAITHQPTQASMNPTSQPSPAATVSAGERIDTVIILLEENHSFDSLFSKFPGANGQPAPHNCPDAPILMIPEKGTSFVYDCSYTEKQVPNYWKLAQSFALCDNYFSEARLPSFPNFSMLTSAESPMTVNPHPPYECPNYCEDITSIANLLDGKGLSWHDYGGMLADIKSLQGRPEISYGKLDGFYQDAAAGKLANVSWIGTYLVGGFNASGHPPANICTAENFAMQVIDAAMSSPQWPSMLVIITWDEYGNFYDHVVPPIVERLPNGKPFRYGFRVPCLVISPYARTGFVSHTEYSHVSTLRTIEAIFDLKPINDRDGTANSLLECLDLVQSPIAPVSLSVRNCRTG